MERTILIILLLQLCTLAFPQNAKLSTKSKKASALYREADNFRVRGQYSQALSLLEQAIKKDKNFFEAYFRMGVIAKATGQLNKAESYFLKVIELNTGNNAPAYFELGELYLQQREYKKAIDYTNKYLAYNPRNSRRVRDAKAILTNAQFAIENKSKKVAFNPQPLSDTVNAFPLQYFPVVSVDQSFLLFTRRLGTTAQDDEDLVVSYKNKDGGWSAPQSLSENINSGFNEGTCTISADGRTLIFTSCYGRKGYGSCDLYVSNKLGDEWSKPKNLGGIVNSSAWDSQPSLSADGRTLYFISNRNGGVGGRDIWYTIKDESNNWVKPKNMGRLINTVNEEVSPFIHPNNRTLYYGTNGLPGFGGFDLYYSNLDNEGWSKPQNIGAPINNGEDQVSLFITADGEKGYYSNENREANKKGILYSFELDGIHELKYQLAYVKGVITDEDTGLPLKANIELYDLENKKRVSLIESDSISGNYLMVLTEGSEYALYVNKEDYLFKGSTFNYSSSTNQVNKEIVRDISLERVKAGAITNLSNIFFDTDKYEIKQNSYAELDKLTRFLKSNPSLIIEISGHTDNVGSKDYNMNLSLRRANSVSEYLRASGIEANRIISKGYGDTKPRSTNKNAIGRQLNRRIELKIVKI